MSQDMRTARELKQRLEELSKKTPYGVFELWEGCGRDLVRKRFYELVKENHPDRYGGNVDASIRDSAQEIFLLIKSSYDKLLMVEGVQTVAERPSTAQTLEESSGARRDVLNRLNQRARDAGLEEMSEPGVAMPNRLDLTATAPGLDESSEVRQLLASRLAKLTQQVQARQLQQTIPGRTAQSTPTDRNAATAMDEEERRAKLARLAQKKSSLFETNPGLRGGEPIPGLGVKPVPADVLTRTSPGVKKEPDAKELFNEGYQQFKLQRYAEALELFQKACDKEAGNGLYLTLRAYTSFLVDPSKRDEAEKALREALQAKHRQAQPDAHLFLGYILKTKGKVEEAQRHFEYALELNPTSHEAEREIRLYKMRKEAPPPPQPAGAEAAGIFKKLFKK